MTDTGTLLQRLSRLQATAEAAYWRLAWDWQSHLTGVPAKPFDMSVFAPEAREMMNSLDQAVYDALLKVRSDD